MTFVIADEVITDEAAFEMLLAYGKKYALTVAHYDHGGQDPANRVTLADIGRLVLIDARLRGQDVGRLINAADEATWAAIPPEASFLDLAPDPTAATVYQSASALYARLTPPGGGVQMTKATKLMHLKRPHLVPIVDSVAQTAYRQAAEHAAKNLDHGKRAYWVAIWADARRNEDLLPPIRARLAEHGSPVASLPSLRLHDILMWSLFSETATR